MGNKRYKPSRYHMYNVIQEFFDSHKLNSGRCLLVGDSIRDEKSSKIKIRNTAITDMLPSGSSIIAPPYPDVDAQSMPYSDDEFDYVISDQVLEHIMKPWLAANEMARVLKPGGWCVTTTCLMNHIHGVPEDYFRFTPAGLESLFSGLSYIETGGYGNLNFVKKALTGQFKVPVRPGTPLAKEVTSNNDNKNLYVVWLIGRK